MGSVTLNIWHNLKSLISQLWNASHHKIIVINLDNACKAVISWNLPHTWRCRPGIHLDKVQVTQWGQSQSKYSFLCSLSSFCPFSPLLSFHLVCIWSSLPLLTFHKPLMCFLLTACEGKETPFVCQWIYIDIWRVSLPHTCRFYRSLLSSQDLNIGTEVKMT